MFSFYRGIYTHLFKVRDVVSVPPANWFSTLNLIHTSLFWEVAIPIPPRLNVL